MSNLKVRCSSLPLVSLCAAAAEPVEIRIDRHFDAADLGTAVHAALAIAVANPDQVRNLGDMADLCAVQAGIYDADPDEARQLGVWTWRCWEQVRQHFPAPQVETHLVWQDIEAGIWLSGHLDVHSHLADRKRLHILDAKTGRVDSSPEAQLRGYALVGLTQHPDVETVYACGLRIRDRLVDGWEWSRGEIMDWWAKMRRHLADRQRYSPGRHCRYCPRGATCEAKAALIRQALSSIPIPGRFASELPDDVEERGPVLAALLRQVRFAKGICEEIEELIRADVGALGGALPAGDGEAIMLTPQQRRTIDPGPGLPVLRRFLNEEALLKATKVSRTEVEKQVREQAANRQKGKAVKGVIDALEEAGALLVSNVERLEIRKAEEFDNLSLVGNLQEVQRAILKRYS